jgi:hypothetical protein
MIRALAVALLALVAACIRPVDEPRSEAAVYVLRIASDATPAEREAVLAGARLWSPQVTWELGPGWSGEPTASDAPDNVIFVSFVHVSHPVAQANNWAGWGLVLLEGRLRWARLVRGWWGNSPWLAGHELGHTMGLNHTTRGLMAPNSGEGPVAEDWAEFCRVHSCAPVAGE